MEGENSNNTHFCEEFEASGGRGTGEVGSVRPQGGLSEASVRPQGGLGGAKAHERVPPTKYFVLRIEVLKI